MKTVKENIFLFCMVLISVFFPARSQFAQDYCFEEAGRIYNVSPDILWTISKAESDHDPFAVNFNKNGTYDFGHMQINSFWYPVIGDTLWNSLGDPCQSTKIGAWILAQCIRRHGYTWQSIGCYNASNEPKKIRYAWRIYRTLAKERVNVERKRQKDRKNGCSTKKM